MIYAAKPQRGGRAIQANTNTPPQDPPPPNLKTDVVIPIENTAPSPSVFIPIENTAPPVPEVIDITPIEVKLSWIRRFVRKIQKIFRRI